MKVLKIITIILITLSVKASTLTISGYIKGTTLLNSSCGDIYISYEDTTHTKMCYDTADQSTVGIGRRYLVTVIPGARGFLKAEREGFVFTPSKLYVGPVLSNKERIHFNAVDTMHPEITFNQIPDNAVMGAIDTIKHTIYENSTITAQTKIYFSVDNNVYTLIAQHGQRNSGFIRKTPITLETVSNLNKIKIVTVDIDGNETTNYSSLFNVIDTTRPTIILDSPSEAEILTLGETKNITWTASDNDSLLYREIYYSHTDDINWKLLNKDTSNTGSYSWVIPEHYSTTCFVKITVTDISENSNTVISKAFTIIENINPVVTIITPTINETIKKATTYDITWSTSDNIGVTAVKMDVSIDNGQSYYITQNFTENVISYTWTVPSTECENCIVKITAYDISGNETSVNSGTFSIVKIDTQAPTMIIKTFPIEVPLKSPRNIRFEASDNDTIVYRVISVSLDSGKTFTLIDSAKWNGGSSIYSWKNNAITEYGQIRITVCDMSFNKTTSLSNIFKIVDKVNPAILITSPSSLEAEKTYTIKWHTEDNDTISHSCIYFSSDSGKTFSLITTDISNLGEFLWTTPKINKTGCYIKIETFDPSANMAEATTNMFDIFLPSSISYFIDIPKTFSMRITRNSFIIGMEKTDRVNITLMSLNGRILINENKVLKAGYHTIARNRIAKGMYILKIKRTNKVIVKKVF